MFNDDGKMLKDVLLSSRMFDRCSKMLQAVFVFLHFIAILLLLVLGISVGYATIGTNLRIEGTSKINSTSWNVKFSAVNVTEGSVTATKAATLGDTLISYDVTLAKPGDFYEFTATVSNTGSINAMLTAAPSISGVSTEQQKYVNYTVTYSDGTAIASGDKLASGSTKDVKVRIEYKTDVEASDLPDSNQTLNRVFGMSYGQDAS